MQKRGQITVFIILGIVLLIIGSMFLYVRTTSSEKILEPELIPAISTIPLEIRPVRLFIEECLSKTAEDAFRTLGTRGGYINPEDHGINANFKRPTEAAAVQFAENSDLKIPYWYYLKSSNTCTGDCKFTSQRPPLYREDGSKSIEAQADKYINENMDSCLTYTAFSEQGFIISPPNNVETNVIIGEKDIGVLINYPTTIRKGDIKHKIDQLYITLPLNFKKIYTLATEITTSEIETNYLETQVLDLITAFAAVDPDKLPPKTESTFDFAGETYWSKQEVKENIQSLLPPYIGAIQIPFTLNYQTRVYSSNVKTAFYAMNPAVNLKTKYTDLAVRFDYLDWWPIYFDLDCSGDLCRPESGNNPLITFIGYQRYDFVYDISYPVIVDVSEPEAFNGRGYSFKFALEGNIRNNEAIDSDFPGYEGLSVPTATLFTAPDMRNSGEITITVKNKVSKTGIEDIQVMYTCGDESVAIGKTDNTGTIVERFPVCLGGIVSFASFDYFIPAQNLNTLRNKRDGVSAEGYEYVDKNITIMKYKYIAIETTFPISNFITSRIERQLAQSPISISNDEEAMITLIKIKDSQGEDDIISSTGYAGSQTGYSILPRLVPGIYEVEGNLILNRQVIIPKDKRKVSGGPFGDDEEYTIPAVVFEDGYPSGGMLLNEKTGYIKITANDLYNSKEIIFYAISPDLPKVIEDFEKAQQIEKLSSKFRSSLDPTYVK